MGGVKKVIARTDLNDILRVIESLLASYNVITIYFPGSRDHRRHRLDRDQVLIKAYRSRGG